MNTEAAAVKRETEWVCAYCGSSADSAPDPAVHHCCGEVGHVELVYRGNGEPVDE